jgi:cytochrome c biogenesis protein CcmG/thiol:disulfide interchange protein DsbE
MSAPAPSPIRVPRRIAYMIPLAMFALVGGFLAYGLTKDPRALPSALVGKPAPRFSLPPLPGRGDAGLSTADLTPGPLLVNVFASWCGPCRVEHPLLTRMRDRGVTIHAINYKDKPEDAQAFLDELGDPFARIGVDRDGRVGIEWGVYGVPETYVVDRQGHVAYRHVGPLAPRDVDGTILPLLEKLR